jgi:hypothetical protein
LRLRPKQRRLEVEEGADKRARAVSRSGRLGESGSSGCGLAGPAQEKGAGRGERAKEETASRPKAGKGEGGKRICFPFSNLIFQITFPNDFQILSKIYQNRSSQKYLCNSMHA